MTQQRLRFLGHLARRESGYLPSLLLSAHDFDGPLRSRRGAGTDIHDYCGLTLDTLRVFNFRVLQKSTDPQGRAVAETVSVCLADLWSALPNLWIVLASFRGWWRCQTAARARGPV